MKLAKSRFLISPGDLNNFIACKFTIKNEIKFINKEISKSEEKVNDKLWKKMGIEHEKKYYQLLKNKYKKSITIKSELDEKKSFDEKIKAMESGFESIKHACIVDEDLREEAYFLWKCNTTATFVR